MEPPPCPTRATEVELHEGLVASSVNCWPGPEHDAFGATQLAGRFLPAGFYYKTFMWPRSFWMRYEHWIRKASGLGEAPRERSRHLRQAQRPLRRAGRGRRPGRARGRPRRRADGGWVILAEQAGEFGGSLLGANETIDGALATAWVERTVAELKAMPEVRLLPRYGLRLPRPQLPHDRPAPDRPPAPGRALWPARAAVAVRAKRVVLATGAIERPLVFGDNDRPGVMLASAVSAYLNRWAVRPGSQAVVFTNNDGAYRTALDLHAAKVPVAAVVDLRPPLVAPCPSRCGPKESASLRARPLWRSRAKQIKAVEVMKRAGETLTGQVERIACDLVAMSGGWNPAVHLFAQSGGKTRWDEDLACFVPGRSVQAERSAGACAGRMALRDCLEAAWQPARGRGRNGLRRRCGTFGPGGRGRGRSTLRPVWLVPGRKRPGHGAKQFVDPQNDVTAGDILLAAREGFRSVEHVKRYTAMGFGTDQGKLSNINGMGILAQALGQDITTGTTTFRPNYTPVTFGTVAGRDVGALFDPVRKTALHEWHVAKGALFENVGQWQRPWYYPRPARTCTRRSPASAGRCARAWACSTPRRWARSTSRGRTRPSS